MNINEEEAIFDRGRKVYQAIVNADKSRSILKGEESQYYKNLFRTLQRLDFKDIDLKNPDHAILLNKFAVDIKRAGSNDLSHHTPLDEKTYAGSGASDTIKKDSKFSSLSSDAQDDVEDELKSGGSVELEEMYNRYTQLREGINLMERMDLYREGEEENYESSPTQHPVPPRLAQTLKNLGLNGNNISNIKVVQTNIPTYRIIMINGSTFDLVKNDLESPFIAIVDGDRFDTENILRGLNPAKKAINHLLTKGTFKGPMDFEDEEGEEDFSGGEEFMDDDFDGDLEGGDDI